MKRGREDKGIGETCFLLSASGTLDSPTLGSPYQAMAPPKSVAKPKQAYPHIDANSFFFFFVVNFVIH